MSNDDLKVAFSSSSVEEAEILRVALQNEGIPCEVDGAHQAGLTGVPIMEVRLLVRSEDLERARQFIEGKAP